MRRDKDLQKQYSWITESAKCKALREKDKPVFERLVKNLDTYLKETSLSGDQARIGQMLIPVYRRAFAHLIGKDIVGVQPLSQPTGYAFALRYSYEGNKRQTDAGGRVVGGRTDFPVPPSDNQRSQANSLIVIFKTTANRVTHAGTVEANAAAFGALPGGSELAAAMPSGTVAKVVYTEDQKALLRFFGDPDNSANRDSIRAQIAAIKGLVGHTGSTVADVVDNQAGYLFIMKKYTGNLSTALGEKLTDDMSELGLTIDKIQVEAITRKLRSRLTREAIQDLKSVHGKDLISEMVDILQYEIAQSVDRTIVDTIRSAATRSTFSITADADGRWQAERFRGAYTEIVRKSNDIARTTLRGPGNFIIGHSDVVTMLEQIPGFAISPVKGDVDSSGVVNTSGSAYVGTLGGRFNIYRDIFAPEVSATVGFKGQSAFETGVIYSPYIPVEMVETIDPLTGNPALIFMERSAVTQSPFSGDKYYRDIVISNLFGS